MMFPTDDRPKYDDEPEFEYCPGYYVISFPFFDFDITLKIQDEYNTAKQPDIYIRVMRDNENVTGKFVIMDNAPDVRPTLYNLYQICRLIIDNMEDVEDADKQSEKT